MEAKPIISWSGDATLFQELQKIIQQHLPTVPVEWERCSGRRQNLHVGCEFVPFRIEDLPSSNDSFVIGRPSAHIFVLENKLESFKTFGRSQLVYWLDALNTRQLPDWLLLVVGQDDAGSKSKPKLLQRKSVLEIVRQEHCSKNYKKLVLLAEPFRSDNRTSKEAWKSLLSALRLLVTSSYDRILNIYETQCQALRKRQIEPEWNYFEYFAIQEELASVYESVSLFEDALLQYDNLEAMFQRCISRHVNHSASQWVSALAGLPCTRVESVVLTSYMDVDKRSRVRARCACLPDFRAYLFSRQVGYLLQLERAWEIPRRALQLVLNSVREARLLDVDCPTGLLACWSFLCCLQTHYICNSYRSQLGREVDGLLAELWRLAVENLTQLGHVCALWPDSASGAENINLVLQLRAAMITTADEVLIGGETPDQKLAKALSSKENFREVYLELSELAYGMFKNVGRLREARRFAVHQLAKFHVSAALANHNIANVELERAEDYLRDALRGVHADSWQSLSTDLRTQLAQCQLYRVKFGCWTGYLKSCLKLSANNSLNLAERTTHWRQAADVICSRQKLVQLNLAVLLRICSISLLETAANGYQAVQLNVFSRCPSSVKCLSVKLSSCSETNWTFEKEEPRSVMRPDCEENNWSFCSDGSDGEDEEISDETLDEQRTSSQAIIIATTAVLEKMVGGGWRLRSSATPMEDRCVAMRERRRSLAMSVSSRSRALSQNCVASTSMSSTRISRSQQPQLVDAQMVSSGQFELLPGHNRILLTAQKPGFFYPLRLNIVLQMIQEDTQAQVILVQNSVERFLDKTWSDKNRMRLLMPSAELCDIDHVMSGFQSTIRFKVSQGALRFSSHVSPTLLLEEGVPLQPLDPLGEQNENCKEVTHQFVRYSLRLEDKEIHESVPVVLMLPGWFEQHFQLSTRPPFQTLAHFVDQRRQHVLVHISNVEVDLGLKNPQLTLMLKKDDFCVDCRVILVNRLFSDTQLSLSKYVNITLLWEVRWCATCRTKKSELAPSSIHFCAEVMRCSDGAVYQMRRHCALF